MSKIQRVGTNVDSSTRPTKRHAPSAAAASTPAAEGTQPLEIDGESLTPMKRKPSVIEGLKLTDSSGQPISITPQKRRATSKVNELVSDLPPEVIDRAAASAAEARSEPNSGIVEIIDP